MEYEPCLQDGKRPSIKKLSGPDGVEAWCIAFAACFINFVMAGLGRMSGILYVAFIDIFQIDRRQAALPFSIRSSMRNLLGPVVGILGQKYGVRNVTLFGGILGTISAAGCFYVDDFLWMIIVWGGINGIGTAFTTTLPQVTIGQHFDKYLSTASGMAFSGGCVGSFLFPALIEYLLYTYAMGGTFLLIAGIIMNTIPACLILREPSWMKKRRKSIQIVTISSGISLDAKAVEQSIPPDKANGNILLEGSSKSNEDDCNSVEICNGGLCNTIEQFGSRTNKNISIDVDFLQRNNETVTKVLMNVSVTEGNLHKNNLNKTFDLIQQDIEQLFSDIKRYQDDDNGFILEKSDHVKSSFENDSMQLNCTQKLNERENSLTNKSDPNFISYISSHTLVWPALETLVKSDFKDVMSLFPHGNHENISKVIEELHKLYLVLEHSKSNSKSLFFSATPVEIISTREMSSEEYEKSNTFMVHIKTAFLLNKKPMFLLICMCRSVHFLTFMPVVTTIVDFAMDKGLPAEDGKYVIAALSVGDLMGRLCLGWITDRGLISIQKYMLLVMIAQGSATIALPFMQSREAVMTGIALFGLLQGSVFVRHPVLVAKYLGRDEQSIAMGCINFFSGIIAFALPSYIGYFRDTIGSYDGIFFINGAIGAFVGFLWIFEPTFVKYSPVEENEGEPSAV